MSGLEGALCRGRWWLFDSTDVADHHAAAELCAECPAIEACRALLAVEASQSLAAYGGPVGTWAGLLVSSRRRQPGRRREPREHGSERGYQQHRNGRDAVCQPCRLSHNAAEKDRAVRKRAG